jgi:Raf kinase inhibitor-like YbhB/YbcL family protein
MIDGDTLPANLKCTRDGGDGLSPPVAWSTVPDGTQSLAVIMHHYPRGRIEGVDTPSHYWLLWNIPAETRAIDRGNPLSIGDEGSDKDQRDTGYTPPCSPAGSQHAYTVTLFALNSSPDALPQHDDVAVDWVGMMQAMDGKMIAQTELTFIN